MFSAIDSNSQSCLSLTFQLSRALSRTWKAGDQVIVTRLDHDSPLSRWMTGTRNHEGLAIAAAAVEYLSSLDDLTAEYSDRSDHSRSARLDRVFRRITASERTLSEALLTVLKGIRGIHLGGNHGFEHPGSASSHGLIDARRKNSSRSGGMDGSAGVLV